MSPTQKTPKPKLHKSALLWLKALKSGTYQQGQGALHVEDRFCCLGVACDLYQKTHKRKLSQVTGRDKFVRYNEDQSYLPSKVQKWLKLQSNRGNFNTGSLSSLNDSGIPFTAIADFIVANADILFITEK